ncbi:MAG: hypothetical protein L6Q59_14355 [Ignavibacteriaceae bacterium]|nr:hypothetical protein [Ignavibacteriaceae bacterium]
MVLDLIVNKTDDGFTAEVPSLTGCESWAHTEDEAISKTIEMVMFYTKIQDEKRLKIDKARGTFKRTLYKIVIK